MEHTLGHSAGGFCEQRGTGKNAERTCPSEDRGDCEWGQHEDTTTSIAIRVSDDTLGMASNRSHDM